MLSAIVATAADASGQVEVRRQGDAHWSPVRVGATFRAGDWIRTRADGFVRLRMLSGGGELSLDSDTTMIVDAQAVAAPRVPGGEPTAGGATVSIQQGTARAVVPEDTREPLVVRNSDGSEATLVRRGDTAAEYRLTPGDDDVEVAVTKGELSVVTDYGERGITAGQAADVARGRVRRVRKMIGFPISLSPGIDARYQFEADMSVQLSWKRVRRAAGYRVQVATDLSFRDIVDSKQLTATSHAFSPPAEGAYAWRVAAMDRDENYGEYGFSRRIFCETEPPTDLLIAPKDGTKLAYDSRPPEVEFSWESAGSARSYRVVVGRTRDPRRDSVFERSTSAQQLTVASLGAGNYYWGVYAQGHDSEPLFLTPRKLMIQKRNAPRAKTDNLWED